MQEAAAEKESTSGLLWWLRAVRSNNVKYLLTSELYAKWEKRPLTDSLSNSESERNARDASAAAAVLWNRSSLSGFCWGERNEISDRNLTFNAHVKHSGAPKVLGFFFFFFLNRAGVRTYLTFWFTIYNTTVSSCEQTILQSIFFSRRVKGMNNECCMRQKTRESRPAGCCCPPCQFAPYVCFGVCVCVFICSPTVTFLWVFTLTGALRTHTHTHTHTPPTGITAEKLHLSEKCPHFNLQLRRSPGPSAQRAFGSAEQSKQERRALISVLCNITIMVNKKANRSPRACSSQASSPLFTLGWRPLWAHPEPMLTPQKYTGILHTGRENCNLSGYLCFYPTILHNGR